MPLKIKKQWEDKDCPRYWLEIRFMHGDADLYNSEVVAYDNEESLVKGYLAYKYLSEDDRDRTFSSVKKMFESEPWLYFDLAPWIDEEHFQGAFDYKNDWGTPAGTLAGWLELPRDVTASDFDDTYNAQIVGIKLRGFKDGIHYEYESEFDNS